VIVSSLPPAANRPKRVDLLMTPMVMAIRNGDFVPEKRIEFRIGIHLDDVLPPKPPAQRGQNCARRYGVKFCRPIDLPALAFPL
jgi:hypothetical protein